ncbi:MAG: porin [Paracoccaceae bacterium]
MKKDENMKKQYLLAGGACACLLASGTTALAQDDSGFSYEIELEIGVDSVVRSDVPANELSDVYLSADAAFEFALGDRVSAFLGLTLESVTGATSDRAFEDLGLYVGEIGLSFDLGRTKLSFGKISPAFGTAWDTAPGFYGTSYAEDYELGEMIGAMAEIELGQGTLTASVFYADDTVLSDSWGTKRGRNTTAAGGAGNTGKLNNFALQYDVEFGSTSLHAGARHLSRGLGDAKDERGLSLGVAHAVSDNLEVMAEVASFDGFGGTTDDALYGTIGLSLSQGPITYNAAFSRRDITSTGVDNLFSLGVDYELKNGATLTAGYGFADEGGTNSHLLGVAIVIPIGG